MADNNNIEFNKAINTIINMGFVKTSKMNSKAVLKYNSTTNKFEKFNNADLSKLFEKIYIESYLKNNWFYDVFNNLPVLNETKAKNYYKYCNVLGNDFNIEKLDQEVQYFIELNNSKKKEFKAIYWNTKQQMQHLINNDIFSNGKALFEYKGAYNFKYILIKNLPKFFKNVGNKKNLSNITIMNNYNYFVNTLTNIGGLYDELKSYNDTNYILNHYKNDYNTIKKMIDNYTD